MKKEKENKEEESKAEEPVFPYGNTIRFFSSFEEMNEADDKEMASLSPTQHLQHITEYIMHVYKDELKGENDLTIRFK